MQQGCPLAADTDPYLGGVSQIPPVRRVVVELEVVPSSPPVRDDMESKCQCSFSSLFRLSDLMHVCSVFFVVLLLQLLHISRPLLSCYKQLQIILLDTSTSIYQFSGYTATRQGVPA